ncbi:hypothetical protein [Labrys wisconsinensis]|uniref:Uncharacterized protein n=1 Tax=Labrys wisconsinensis TaxID=425677 RepID=A0ABU0JG03_9HYPH|nr:hypothetical protein [Labrys wisconsinensis]MDQ0473211.1 hypothetical protein [Labrys wisconsinensis]
MSDHPSSNHPSSDDRTPPARHAGARPRRSFQLRAGAARQAPIVETL